MRQMRRRLGDAFTRPGEELSRWGRFLRFQLELWRFCMRRLNDHNVGEMSAALSFRTIFALIPILVFALLAMKSLGMIEESKQSLRRFLDLSGLAQMEAIRPVEPHEPQPVTGHAMEDTQGAATARPGRPAIDAPGENPAGQPTDGAAVETPGNQRTDAAQAGTAQTEAAQADAIAEPEEVEPEVYNVAAKIEELVTNIEDKLTLARMGPAGAILLIWTAVGLLMTMESSLNRIFGAPRSRPWLRRVLLFWAALTLGPVALAAAAYTGRSLLAMVEQVSYLGWMLVVVGWAGPIAVGMLVVAALYKTLPNTRVRNDAAVGGAVVAVPLWLTARWALAWYVEQFVTETNWNIYGVLGLVPLFFLWLNLSWLIFLFGAELAHTATNLGRMKLAEKFENAVIGPSDFLAVALAVARRFQSGQGASYVDDVADTVNLPGELAARIMNRLTAARILCAVNGDETAGYTLARPAGRIELTEVLDVADPPPHDRVPEHDGAVWTGVETVRGQVRGSIAGKTVEQLLGNKS